MCVSITFHTENQETEKTKQNKKKQQQVRSPGAQGLCKNSWGGEKKVWIFICAETQTPGSLPRNLQTDAKRAAVDAAILP